MKIKFFIILFLLFFFIVPIDSRGYNTEKTDSERMLITELNHAEGPDRLSIIEELVSLYWDVPQEEFWLKRLYEESIKYDSVYKAEFALKNLARYYHNCNMSKELADCSAKADLLAKRSKYHSYYYFVTKSFVCQRFLWDEQYEQAIIQASSLLNLAAKERNQDGIVCSEELFGLIYQLMGRYDKALEHTQIAFKIINEKKYKNITDIAQMTTTLIEIQLKLNNLNEAQKLINSFIKIQKDIEKGTYGIKKGFPIQRNYRLAYTYYATLFLQKKDLISSKTFLDKASVITESDVYVDFMLNYAKALYEKSSGNYQAALDDINKVIEADGGSNIEYLAIRAEIYAKLGWNEKASDEYKKCLQMKVDSDNVKFDKQVAYLQHLYDTKNLELQLKDKEIQFRKIENRSLVLVSTILMASILILIYFLSRNRRLRKLLERNNAKLEKSEDMLKLALQKGSEVERLKMNFLHNISHEIRTPLNSIVGFSSVLVNDTSCDKEMQKDFCRLIQENSDALLNIINEIIEISEYENSIISINPDSISSCSVKTICTHCIDKIHSASMLHENVKVILESNKDDYQLATNSERLEKLIMNLLTNSAKYTEQGSITLSFEMSADSKFIIFSVTDTGKGISEDLRKKLFSKFEKGESFVQGIGLGLSLCKILAKGFGGEIHLDETYTSGARFVFSHSTSLHKIKEAMNNVTDK